MHSEFTLRRSGYFRVFLIKIRGKCSKGKPYGLDSISNSSSWLKVEKEFDDLRLDVESDTFMYMMHDIT